MQTLTVDIQDNFVEDFLSMMEQYKDKIQVKKDQNIEQDPYFYERQKELHQIKNDIDKGNIQMVSHDTVWGNIKNHIKTIETK